jgi:adenylylsulfate kinase
VPVPTLLLTGTVAAGKTVIASEISDVLAELGIPNAALDLDALVWQWPATTAWNAELMFKNLAVLWPNYRDHGSTHLVLARVLEERRELDRYRDAIPDADIVVCRLTASEEERIERLRRRMPPGDSREWHIVRSRELAPLLERAAIDDFVVKNEMRPVRAAACEVLLRAGWIDGQQMDAVLARSPGQGAS